MAKANLVLPNGTKVTIEGTSAEVAALLEKFSQPSAGSRRRPTSRKKSAGSSKKTGTPKKKAGPTGHIFQLRDEGFFKSRRSLPDVQRKLEEHGHIYAQSSLSPILVRLVRGRDLRRFKEKKGWVYVN